MTELMNAVVEGEPLTIPAAERVPERLHQAIVRGLERDPERRWPSLTALLEHIEDALAEVQPGLFTATPPVAALAVPILVLLPLALLAVEGLGLLAYRASNWAWLSTIQVTLMAGASLVVRRRLAEFLGHPRMVAGPSFVAALVLGHRLIAALSGAALETMFAYDFLALFSVIAIVVYLADRSLWPTLSLPLALTIAAVALPSWAPRMWAVFTIGMPILVGVFVARSRDRLRDGGTFSRSRGHSSAPRNLRSSPSANGTRKSG